jgi:transposase
MRKLVDEALRELDYLFDRIYAKNGRESIPPERLIRASLLQVLYTIRSERQLVEQIQYNMLYRWFVGLEIEDAVWNHSTFSKNRERLLQHDVMDHFFESVLDMARKRDLLSEEHFSVDGTLVDAWASHQSFHPRDEDDNQHDGTGGKDFHGETRNNETHVSSTDPEAQLKKKSKGTASRPSYGVHNLMENRNGLVVGVTTKPAATVTETDAAMELITSVPGSQRKTLAADKGYDTKGFVEACQLYDVTPHVAQNHERKGGSAIDGRTTRHAGYRMSQFCRKQIEKTFGWAKQYGGLRRMQFRGLDRVGSHVTFIMTAFNLLRMRNIELQGAL